MNALKNSTYIQANPEKVNRLNLALKQHIQKSSPLSTLIRIKGLIAYYKSVDPKIVAICYDIHIKSLMNWVERFESEGEDGIEDKPRSGRPTYLPPEQASELKALVEKDNQRVWTARHIFQNIMTMFSVCYSVKYIPEFLRNMGLSFHKAVHELIKKNSERREAWIKTQLPAIYATQIAEGWRIFFQDEVGFQTEGTLTYSWGKKGEPIEIKNYGRHGRMNMMGAFELGSGIFYGVLTRFKVTALRFQRFICHLKHEMPADKILLICDNASFHKAKWLQEWYKLHKAWLKMEFLPAYSPDFNPIERLWRWFKSEFTHNVCWANLKTLREYLNQKLAALPMHRVAMLGVMQKEISRLKIAYEFYETEFPFPLLVDKNGKDFSG